MKYLLVITVVLVAVWVWRNNRQNEPSDASRPGHPRPVPRPAHMVACVHCAMHLPEDEAVHGRQGLYCCHEHRRQAEETPD